MLGDDFGFKGAKVLDAVAVFAAPGDERRLGNVEFGRNASQSPALGAQLDEAIDEFGIICVHNAIMLTRS